MTTQTAASPAGSEKITGIYLVHVEGIPPGPNARLNVATWKRLRRRYRAASAEPARAILAQRGGRPIRHAIISYTFLKPHGEPYDTDNALSLAKPLIDGLVEGGLLVGDNTRQVEYQLPVRQTYGPERAVEIVIMEVCPTEF